MSPKDKQMPEDQLPHNQNFWAPQFIYEHRDDGSILMQQKDALQSHLPLLADYLDKWAKAAPERIWIARREHSGQWLEISYQQALTKACSIGSALLEMGLGPERPLLILSENSIEHALLGIACAYTGIPYAPISPAYSLISKDAQKVHAITDLLQPGAIFADDGEQFSTVLSKLSSDDVTIINARNTLSLAQSFDKLLTHDPQHAVKARATLTPETVVKYLFTSGSTGSPKAVINTNRMICAMQQMVRDCYRFLSTSPPVVLDWMPWNHTAAGNKTFYLALTNGGSYYIDDGRPAPGKFDETIRNLKDVACNWYFTVPIGYDLLVDALEHDDDLARTFFTDLNMLFYAGAGMAQHTWDKLTRIAQQITGREILLATGLGATETAPFALAWTQTEARAGNIGVPSRGLTLKLVPIDGKLEARLKGPTITPGYFGDAAKSAEVFDDEGFYCLGDALRPADPDDFSAGFFFDGRLAENFKLSTGTWVAVGAVRATLVDAMGGLIRDAVIVGENESHLGALLWLSERAQQMNATELHERITERLAVASSNGTGSASRIRRAALLSEPPSFDKGELTEKGSLNQRALRTHNKPVITQMYASDDGVYCV